MALKKTLTKAEFDKLPEHFKTEYTADGDTYKLDVEGEEDTGALKRALLREKENAKTTKARLAEIEEELESLKTNDARSKNDVATVEKNLTAKFQKQADETKTQYEARINALTSHATKTLVDNKALEIASKISNAPNLILPHIKARLQASFEGDEPATVVLDKDGKPSALTLDQLRDEFVANKDFSAIIIASKASGGAPKPATNQNGGAGNQQNPNQPADLSKVSAKDLAATLKESKANQEA
jgi:hypothetical protein